MTKTKNQTHRTSTTTSSSKPAVHKQPVIEHLREVKRRFIYIALTVAAGSIAAYALERHIVNVLLRPSHGQKFIYTSPLGGMNFLFSVCFQIGLIAATPVIMYNLLAFLKPLMRRTSHTFLLLSSIAATVTAAGGLVFGYYVGLPSALHFLLNQFATVQVKPLITIQSYVSFVAMYMLGSALMFQLPLLILLINRIKPLKPSGLLKYERHAIAGSFVVAFIMNPTPNIIDQLFVVVPVLVMYQLSIVMLWFVNRGGVADLPAAVAHIPAVVEADIQRQAVRLEAAAKQFVAPAQPMFQTASKVAISAGRPFSDIVVAPPRPKTNYYTAPDNFRRSNFGVGYNRRLVQ